MNQKVSESITKQQSPQKEILIQIRESITKLLAINIKNEFFSK